MNKKIKIIFTILIVCITISNVAYGFNLNDINATPPTNNPLMEPAKGVLGFIQAVGVVISVVTLIVIGIKYMMGSVEEKADYKKTLMPYFIGAVLLFAASTFAQILYEFVKSI